MKCRVQTEDCKSPSSPGWMDVGDRRLRPNRDAWKDPDAEGRQLQALNSADGHQSVNKCSIHFFNILTLFCRTFQSVCLKDGEVKTAAKKNCLTEGKA